MEADKLINIELKPVHLPHAQTNNTGGLRYGLFEVHAMVYTVLKNHHFSFFVHLTYHIRL